MRIFEIVDELKYYPTVAYLFYYEAEREFHIEIIDGAKPIETPFYLALLLEKGEHSINAYYSLEWVRQRIVPEDRQNIGDILREHHLEYYDEFRLLLLSKGRCSQDDYVIHEIRFEDLPDCIQARFHTHIETTFQLTLDTYLLFFKNGKSRLIDVKKDLNRDAALRQFLSYFKDRSPYVETEAGGSALRFREDITVSSERLAKAGSDIGVTKDDFYQILERQLVNTREACELLSCSRQNIDDLVRRGKLRPVKEGAKDTLFLRSDVEARKK